MGWSGLLQVQVELVYDCPPPLCEGAPRYEILFRTVYLPDTVYGLAEFAEHVGNGRRLRSLCSLVRIFEIFGNGRSIADLGCKAKTCMGRAQGPR